MSQNYEKVKYYYDTIYKGSRLWTMEMVKNAVDRWITAEEFLEITGKEYEKKE